MAQAPAPNQSPIAKPSIKGQHFDRLADIDKRFALPPRKVA